jgi:protein-tyrosine kinase
MKDLVQELKTRYADRYVIFDSSPLLATTEPTVLNEMVDGILFVIKSGTTPRESVSHALKMLDREKIMGVVLNDLQFKTQGLIRRYFGHTRYYGDYRYTSERSEPRGIKSFFKRRGSGKKDISA